MFTSLQVSNSKVRFIAAFNLMNMRNKVESFGIRCPFKCSGNLGDNED